MKDPASPNRILTFFIGFLFILVIVFGAVSLINPALTKICFSDMSYYLMLALLIFWFVSFIRVCEESRIEAGSFLRTYGWGILFSFGLALLIFISVQPYFRLLADETNLLAISKSMLYERHIHNVTEGKWYYFNFNPINVEAIPKRPLLFPFLTSIVSTLIGFHAFNPFLLNFVLLVGLFFVIFFAIRKAMGAWWAYSALILIAAQPVLSQTATSGGFDLLALFFIFLSFLTLRIYLNSPSAPRFQFLVFNLLMLANVRYETPLFILVALGFLLMFRRIKTEYVKSSFAFALAPLFLMPYLWQRLLVRNSFEWLDASHPAPFAVAYFLKNLSHFFASIVHFNFLYPYAVVVNLIGLGSCLFLLVLFISKKWPRKRSDQELCWIVLVSSLALWTVMLAYGEGDPTHPASSRFFVYFAVLASLSFLILFWRMSFIRKRPAVILSIALAAFFLYHPLSIDNRFQNALSLPREYRIVLDFLDKQESKNSLIISDRPGMYTAHNFSAVSFHTANKDKNEVLLQFRRHLYDKVFVIQEISYETKQATQNTVLDPAYSLETLYELQNTATSFLRISRVVPSV